MDFIKKESDKIADSAEIKKLEKLDELEKHVLAGAQITDAQIELLCTWDEKNIEALNNAAYRIREHYFGKSITFCGIVNAKSGVCSEDCKFCAQSKHYKTKSTITPFLSTAEIVEKAEVLYEAKASRYGIVTSGKGLDENDITKLVTAIKDVKKTGMIVDISVGIQDKKTLSLLKDAGAEGYHHNLETARSFFPKICTSHDYEEDVQTVADVVALGFYVCSGGIFGLGESFADRVELAKTLTELQVDSVPINFLHPIAGTPLAERAILSVAEALKIVALYRFMLPKKHLRICGGRHTVFQTEESQRLLFLSGASGMMIGDYLTVAGDSAIKDTKRAEALALAIN